MCLVDAHPVWRGGVPLHPANLDPLEQVVSMLDRALEPVLRLLASPAGPAAEPCLALLCTLLELRPEYDVELRGCGAARLAVDCLLHGSAEAQDAAARAIWLLVRANPRRLLCGSGGQGDGDGDGDGQGEAGSAVLLGCSALDLLPPLTAIYQLGREQEARWAAEQEAAGGSVDGGGGGGGCSLAGREAPEVCSAAEAELLLQELAAVYPEARAVLPAEAAVPAKPTGCCIM